MQKYEGVQPKLQ